MESFDYTRGMVVAMLFQLLILLLPALFSSEENEMNNSLDEREQRLVANCCAYAEGDPAGLPGHNLMIIIAKLKAQIDDLQLMAKRAPGYVQPERLDTFLATAERDALVAYIQNSEKLLQERNRVLEAIPECSVHGRQCVPHALEWVEAQLAGREVKSHA